MTGIETSKEKRRWSQWPAARLAELPTLLSMNSGRLSESTILMTGIETSKEKRR